MVVEIHCCQFTVASSLLPVVIKEDNQGAIAIANNPIVHTRTKHIDIRYHYIREVVQKKEIELEYCPSEEMIADALTEPLLKGQFEKLRYAMGMGMQES